MVSCVDELTRDKMRIDEWKSKAEASSPGRDASFDDKLKWYHELSESVWYSHIMMGEPEPQEFLPAVLLDACDDSVELQIIVQRSHAKKLNDIDNEDKVKFMASAERARGEPLRQRILNKARSTEKGLAAYVEWLENAAPSCEMRPKTAPKPATLLHPDAASAMQPVDEVVVAAMTLDKSECWEGAVRRLMRNTGLYGTVEAPRTTSDWSTFAHNVGAGVNKVGEHLFYVNKHGKCCVALELVAVSQRKSKEPAKSAAFHAECTRLSAAHGDKTCITIGKDEKDKVDDNVADKPTEWPDEDSSSEEEQESGDDMSRPPVQAIWLPKFYSQERERCFAHIHDGAGETSSVKQRLQNGTTVTGNVRFAIVESEFKWTNQRFRGDADKDKKYFCALLALTQAIVYDDSWLWDNECWDEIADFMKKLAAKWRELLKMDEAALGLGLAGNPKHTPQMSKTALMRLLNWLKGQIEAHPDTDYKFSLATRKRRADAGMSKADWDAKKAPSAADGRPAPKKAKKAKK